MGPVATVLGSANLQNIKTPVFLETLDGKITRSRKIYKAVEASFQNGINKHNRASPEARKSQKNSSYIILRKNLVVNYHCILTTVIILINII